MGRVSAIIVSERQMSGCVYGGGHHHRTTDCAAPGQVTVAGDWKPSLARCGTLQRRTNVIPEERPIRE